MSIRPRGFTLLELLVSMSLLAALGVLVFRILTGGLDLWSRGEAIRDLLERSCAVADLVGQDLEQIAGTGEGTVVAARLVDAPIEVPGLDGGPLRAVRFLRKLRPWEESRRAHWDHGSPQAVSDDVSSGLLGLPEGLDFPPASLDSTPGERHGEPSGSVPAAGPGLAESALVLFFPFVSRFESEAPGAFLSLRRGEVRGSGIGYRHPWFGRAPFPSVVELLQQTEEVLDGLLHFELRYWSQTTRSWEGLPIDGGPESAWDSSRGGATLDGGEPLFSHDLGPWSLEDPSDDLMPRLILLELVIDRPPGEARCAMLREGLGEKETGPLRVDFIERLGTTDGPGYFKVGGEWIRYRERRGEFLHGLDRGARGTRSVAHSARSLLRVGWTVRRLVKPSHPREWWGPVAPEPDEERP